MTPARFVGFIFILLVTTGYLLEAISRKEANLLAKTYTLRENAARCVPRTDDTSRMCKIASKRALKTVANLLRGPHNTGELVNQTCNQTYTYTAPGFTTSDFGTGFGLHVLDRNKFAGRSQDRPGPCVFYSYGIGSDYSFDSQLARDWDCHGFLLDPTEVHPAKIGPGLRYFYVGAPMLEPSLQEPCSPTKGCVLPTVVSPSQLMVTFKHSWLAVLKMDCEGCEFALARDIAREDPGFFSKVGQFAVEVHVPKVFLKDDLHAHYLGLLYSMVFESGLELAHASIGGCSPEHDATGCVEALADVGYPCGKGLGCQNLLFSRR